MTAAQLREDLEIQASTDPLTGLLNRRAIEVAAEQQILACNRSGSHISAIILDLDDFKQINDTIPTCALTRRNGPIDLTLNAQP